MRKGFKSRLGSLGRKSWRERRRSSKSVRRKSFTVLKRPGLWKYALLACFFPCALPFEVPATAKVVPIRNAKVTSCSDAASLFGRRRRSVVASAVEEMREDLRFHDPVQPSDMIELEDNTMVAKYTERNGFAKRNGVSQKNGVSEPPSVKELWEPRHARSIQEGIRRETSSQLSSLLNKAKSLAGAPSSSPAAAGRGYAARTISGLIHALAEEADGLEVAVDTQSDSPLWDKKVDTVRINFSRLGFKPLRISGLDRALRKIEGNLPSDDKMRTLELAAVCCPDEAFDRIDVDNSGALDSEEIASALNVAATTDSDKELLEGLASQLVELYDFNGDGVVDRGEYQSMVEDMAALRQEQKQRKEEEEEKERKRQQRTSDNSGWMGMMKNAVKSVLRENTNGTSTSADASTSGSRRDFEAFPDDPALMDSVAKGEGSIVFSDLKLDLRRLLFGVFPLLKNITPGGPLILEPFTMTLSGSFNSDDVMESFLLDAGLRRLVTRVLRRRIMFQLRDLIDGAVFYGRTWKMFSEDAPLVEVPKLEHVEFDKQNRMIISGRALVRTGPDSPSIEQAFKVRCRIGTRANGRVIRLVDPELALILECPKAWERNIVGACQRLDLPVPTRPQPLYSYFPIYSRFKLEDKDGFDLGEDNKIKSISIKDGALRFEMSAVLRPGRFLGNHYLAFAVPNRTFIITMDRVREGIRAARKNKKEARKAQKRREALAYSESNTAQSATTESVSSWNDLKFKDQPVSRNGVSLFETVRARPTPKKSFFSRFVEGYLGSKETKEELHEIRTERLTAAISDWFGRQGSVEGEGI